MKQIDYLFCCLLITSSAMGQDSTITLRQVHRAIIKFAPFSLLDQDATVQAGLEYRTGAKTSVQAELGYGWKGLSVFEADLDDFVKAEVWRVRNEVRFYSGRYRTNRRRGIAVRSDFPLGNYWAIDGLFKQINLTKSEYDYQPTDTNSPYRYLGLTNISRYVLGSHLKLGRQYVYYDPRKGVFSRTLVDIYIGAGVRWATNDIYQTVENPSETCGCGIGRSFTDRGSQLTPSLTAGLKIGFAL